MSPSRDVVGQAIYEVVTDLSGLRSGLGLAGSEIKSSMAALGAIAAGLFGMAAVGALQMQNAQAQYRAATGASITETEAWSKSINDMSANNVQSFEQIAAVSTKVRQDLQLTGAAQAQVTQEILTFSRATGVDATQAVEDFHSATKAWHMDESLIPGLMDQLVASSRRYGGSLQERLDALTKLGPAMQALGVDEDHAIGLLNLWTKAGLDTGLMQRGLNAAITKMPPGESLMQFLDHLQSIQDPLQRDTEAIKVFGSRIGPNLANALGDSTLKLSDFTITTDQASGATKNAADAMDSTFGAKFTLLMNSAKAAVRGLGDEFGPAGSLLAGIGAVSPALTGMLRGIGVSPSIVGAARLAGAAVGGEFGLAFQAAAVVAIPAAVLGALQWAAGQAQGHISGLLGGSGMSPDDLHAKAQADWTANHTYGPPAPSEADLAAAASAGTAMGDTTAGAFKVAAQTITMSLGDIILKASAAVDAQWQQYTDLAKAAWHNATITTRWGEVYAGDIVLKAAAAAGAKAGTAMGNAVIDATKAAMDKRAADLSRAFDLIAPSWYGGTTPLTGPNRHTGVPSTDARR